MGKGCSIEWLFQAIPALLRVSLRTRGLEPNLPVCGELAQLLQRAERVYQEKLWEYDARIIGEGVDGIQHFFECEG